VCSSDLALNGPPALGGAVANVGGGVITIANGINGGPAIQAGQNRTTTVASDSTFQAGWYNQTLNNANAGNLLTSAGFTIDGFVSSSVNPTSLKFWEQQANGTETLLGSFVYDRNSGIMTFTAVPEPSTYGLMAGLGLLVLAVRRQVKFNKA